MLSPLMHPLLATGPIWPSHTVMEREYDDEKPLYHERKLTAGWGYLLMRATLDRGRTPPAKRGSCKEISITPEPIKVNRALTPFVARAIRFGSLRRVAAENTGEYVGGRQPIVTPETSPGDEEGRCGP